LWLFWRFSQEKRFHFAFVFWLSFPGERRTVFLPLSRQKEESCMKKSIGLVALCVFGLVVASALAQIPEVPAAPVAAPVAAVATAVAAVAAPAGEIAVKGKVSVVNGPDGALQAIYINPADPMSHGYKVDIVNGEGKTLADKHGKIVDTVGVDANRLYTIKTITVVE
jgi:hypothetical protein